MAGMPHCCKIFGINNSQLTLSVLQSLAFLIDQANIFGGVGRS